MIRKPLPKEAARLVRAFLNKEGLELSQRKALDIVALVEGHNSWQAMSAQTKTAQSASSTTTSAQTTPQSGYEKCWSQVATALMLEMQVLHRALAGRLKDGFVLKGPEIELNDEYRIGLWVEVGVAADAQHPVPMLALFTLVEREDGPGQFALRFSIEDPYESFDYVAWTSGPRFGDSLWSDSAEELLERLESHFCLAELLVTLHADARSEEYLARRE